MIIKDIQARTLLGYVKQPDPWFGLKYNLNLYRGCQHQCIYCDTRSECYRIENFNQEILVKANAIDLLRQELSRKRIKGTIGFGSMNDPYMPLEADLQMTRRALEVVSDFKFPVHIITKSDLVTRDIDLLQKINKTYCAVSITVTTTDDSLAGVIEPGAPSPSRRLAAIRALSEAGILCGITLMPVLPFIEDNEPNIEAVVREAADHGAKYILLSLGMSMRDRQREWYYHCLDQSFPGLRQRYVNTYGENYHCPVPDACKLESFFNRLCLEHRISRQMPMYTGQNQAEQPGLF